MMTAFLNPFSEAVKSLNVAADLLFLWRKTLLPFWLHHPSQEIKQPLALLAALAVQGRERHLAEVSAVQLQFCGGGWIIMLHITARFGATT